MPFAFNLLQTIPEDEAFELKLVDLGWDDDLPQPLPPWDPIEAPTSASALDPVGAVEIKALGVHLVNFHWTRASRQEESSPLLLLLIRQEEAVE